ncbi:hypothetical protein FHS72_002695 [Loktanella ponticola]|uniref:Uncharacterized protein n=1 Tax=Yoonia ponticola TaxID=1524255 RepID=A0A7W9BN30_9RHOB|nr:hypothetical protein [Yoonia ponticola]MBB5723059.1 hypothetical protein [Yoonia ponticola]
MHSITTNEETRLIIERAHAERAEMVAAFFQKLFSRKPSAAHTTAEQPA